MARLHPDFPKHTIYEGAKGDRPVPGQFYTPREGDSLSSIAKLAYAPSTSLWPYIQRINKSPYNLGKHTYLQLSSKCTSKKVDAATVLKMSGWTSTNQGWLALCPQYRDDRALALGYSYPIIWVPLTGADLPTPGGQVVPKSEPKPDLPLDIPIDADYDIDIKPHDKPADALPVDIIVTPEPEQAGMSGWLVGAMLAAGLGALVWGILKKK